MKQQLYSVDYNVLKSNIIKSCIQVEKDELLFEVNYDKLSDLSEDIGLAVVDVGTKSKAVEAKDIIILSEYFKGKKLSWFNENKEYTQLVFVKLDNADDHLLELLEDMNTNEVDDPDIDKAATLAEIIANYPCYTATVVAYNSNNPERLGKISYMIGCRANTITITQENYKYNEKDMV